jgi:hypothetical protein
MNSSLLRAFFSMNDDIGYFVTTHDAVRDATRVCPVLTDNPEE